MTNYTYKIYYEDDSTTFKRNGGWKLVRGHTPEQAVRKFRAKFPDLYPLSVQAKLKFYRINCDGTVKAVE